MTPASVESVQKPVGSPIRKDSVKRVRFQVEQKGYHTRSGRMSKPPHRSDVTTGHIMSMVQRLYSTQYIISCKLRYNVIPQCDNATILTFYYPTIMDGL